MEVGKIYLFTNFTVKEYQEEDKFRCVLNNVKIIFSNETKMCEVCIERPIFDFYDIGDLKQL